MAFSCNGHVGDSLSGVLARSEASVPARCLPAENSAPA
ncbi:hypothetical protein C791_7733 [Amycolatopsis azurea DSM 43854]|uniref:Uncharacterized protein n=1 Tax=Amycolatopsis azurea DSM 43854 TaxID=1238180 RepID=M2PFC7_9PSEU|nr:hypothetical protein C791_7733 [Amycolatopsis azurea DSM 43854]